MGKYTSLARKFRNKCQQERCGDEKFNLVHKQSRQKYISPKVSKDHAPSTTTSTAEPPTRTAPVDAASQTAAHLRSANLANLIESPPPEAARLGLVAVWSREFGFISIHDPDTGEWWDLQTKDAPDWAVREARKRRELYKDGNRRAYRLTSREMEEIWEAERKPEVGIVEDHPIEEEG